MEMEDYKPAPEPEEDVELGKESEEVSHPIPDLTTAADSCRGIQLRKFIEHSPDDASKQMKESLMNEAFLQFIFAIILMFIGFAVLMSVSYGAIRADADLPTEWLNPLHIALNIAALSVMYIMYFIFMAFAVCYHRATPCKKHKKLLYDNPFVL